MKRSVLCLVLLFCISRTNGQDTAVILQEVSVRGFGTNRQQLQVPASISILTNRDLQRFSDISLVPVMNTVPGVRMEERSPGSYRLSVRGSLLRSPFGVRNIKVYWKDMPLTDAGGNTYFNLLDFNGIGQIEIIKGPAGSIYGAGTGGVVTLAEPEAMKQDGQTFRATLNGGSYGLFGASFNWQGSDGKFKWNALQSHLQSDGYRENSRLRKDVTQFNGRWDFSPKDQLEVFAMYADLAYRTPGGLTLAQMNKDPRQARPATPVLPSAVQQHAAVYNKTLFAGLTNTYLLSKNWKNITTAIFSNTDFENPFITNYEKRQESGIALRTRFNWNRQWNTWVLNLSVGAEWQRGNATIDSTGNNAGVPDNNLVRDKFKSLQEFLFTQAELNIGQKLIVQAGLSWNAFQYDLQRIIPEGPPSNLDFDNQLLPRVGILYRIANGISLHGSVSKGYSAPSLAEIRPSAGGIYSDLQAEYGWNYEAGLKGRILRSRIGFDLTVFRFNLDNAIVRRNNAAGAEYFVNAGSTRQDGFEGFAEWYAISRNNGLLRQMKLWSSVSIFDFKFTDYKINNNDYSGNELTGVPSQVILAGLDLVTAPGLYMNTTFNYTSSIPLTDQNDVYASPYRLWQIRLGWRKHWKNKISTDIFLGVDNAANELYSLGNDINAFGRRYYNPAADRNYYGGVRLSF